MIHWFFAAIRRFFAEEGAKLKEMDFTEKRQYIWEYYKLQIFIAVIVLFIAGSTINRILNPPKQDYLYIAWQGGMTLPEQLIMFGDRLSIIVEDYERYGVAVRSYVLSGDPQFDQALIGRFHALISVGDIHAIITTREYIREFAEFGIIIPITDVLAELEKLCQYTHEIIAERVYSFTFVSYHENDTVTDAMAIDISGAPLLEELELFGDNIYIATIINTDRFYETAKALYVMFYEGAG